MKGTNMLKFDLCSIGLSRQKFEQSLQKYEEIVNLFHETNVAEDDNFQRLFNGFYITSPLSKTWYVNFYRYFENVRNDNPTFEKVITDLYNINGQARVDASFCSKLVATINPDKPIIDQYIMWQMGYNLKTADSLKGLAKIHYYVDAYSEIEKQYKEHIDDVAIKTAIAEFDSIYPNYKWLSPIKKLDFILWSNRNYRTFSVFEYYKLKEG